MSVSVFEWKQWKFEGISEGGIRTSISCPALDCMFDFGAVHPDRVNTMHLLLTHAHLDHSAGLPYFISQRSLQKLKPPKIFVPASTRETWKKIIDLYSELEGFSYQYELHGLEFGERQELKPGFYFKPLPSFHRVPSQGYTIYQSSKKLKAEYKNLSQKEIIHLKSEGVEPNGEFAEPLVSFSGDTKIEYVLENPDVQKSKILFMECTYYCDKRDTNRAREWGHTHLNEIAENHSAFQNEALVLIHASKRYSYREAKEWMQKKLPESLLQKTFLFHLGQNKK